MKKQIAGIFCFLAGVLSVNLFSAPDADAQAWDRLNPDQQARVAANCPAPEGSEEPHGVVYIKDDPDAWIGKHVCISHPEGFEYNYSEANSYMCPQGRWRCECPNGDPIWYDPSKSVEEHRCPPIECRDGYEDVKGFCKRECRGDEVRTGFNCECPAGQIYDRRDTSRPRSKCTSECHVELIEDWGWFFSDRHVEGDSIYCPAGVTPENYTPSAFRKSVRSSGDVYSCNEGYFFSNANCIQRTVENCGPDYEAVGSECLEVCDENLVRNESNACVCPEGFSTINNRCVSPDTWGWPQYTCPSGSKGVWFDSGEGSRECIAASGDDFDEGEHKIAIARARCGEGELLGSNGYSKRQAARCIDPSSYSWPAFTCPDGNPGVWYREGPVVECITTSEDRELNFRGRADLKTHVWDDKCESGEVLEPRYAQGGARIKQPVQCKPCPIGSDGAVNNQCVCADGYEYVDSPVWQCRPECSEGQERDGWHCYDICDSGEERVHGICVPLNSCTEEERYERAHKMVNRNPTYRPLLDENGAARSVTEYERSNDSTLETGIGCTCRDRDSVRPVPENGVISNQCISEDSCTANNGTILEWNGTLDVCYYGDLNDAENAPELESQCYTTSRSWERVLVCPPGSQPLNADERRLPGETRESGYTYYSCEENYTFDRRPYERGIAACVPGDNDICPQCCMENEKRRWFEDDDGNRQCLSDEDLAGKCKEEGRHGVIRGWPESVLFCVTDEHAHIDNETDCKNLNHVPHTHDPRYIDEETHSHYWHGLPTWEDEDCGHGVRAFPLSPPFELPPYPGQPISLAPLPPHTEVTLSDPISVTTSADSVSLTVASSLSAVAPQPPLECPDGIWAQLTEGEPPVRENIHYINEADRDAECAAAKQDSIESIRLAACGEDQVISGAGTETDPVKCVTLPPEEETIVVLPIRTPLSRTADSVEETNRSDADALEAAVAALGNNSALFIPHQPEPVHQEPPEENRLPEYAAPAALLGALVFYQFYPDYSANHSFNYSGENENVNWEAGMHGNFEHESFRSYVSAIQDNDQFVFESGTTYRSSSFFASYRTIEAKDYLNYHIEFSAPWNYSKWEIKPNLSSEFYYDRDENHSSSDTGAGLDLEYRF